MSWLPEAKLAAVCFSIDDVHPSTSSDLYEAGGDLHLGVLGRIGGLLTAHTALKATLFVTPDWRPKQLVALPARRALESSYQVDLHPSGTFGVDKHPEFVDYLNSLPRTEVAPHGLEHVNRGSRLAVEFAGKSREQCTAALRTADGIFRRAGLESVAGFSPPGWDLSTQMIQALSSEGFQFVGSARDLVTSIRTDAVANMSGLKNVSLLHPEIISGSGLVHLPTNFQATSALERAHQIIRCGGLLSIKAHAFKHGGGHHQLDGLDAEYCGYLHGLFDELERCYGDALWWTSMGEVAQSLQSRTCHPAPLTHYG